MNNIVINIEELGFKIERLLLTSKFKEKPPRLSELFLVIGNNEEGSFEQELSDKFLENLRLNLFDKDAELSLYVMNSKKIKVFYTRNCYKIIEGQKIYKSYILDSRKFNLPVVSTPKSYVN